MDVKLYDLPTLQSGRIAVEETYCYYVNLYRKGIKLDPEILDWMDSANSWLMTIGNKL